jgi:mRNA-degrading endonuclease toxin of MazEF toxin-antitoxin module
VTQSAGNNTTALATTAFVTTAVATSSGAPYDLPCEIPGTPPTSIKVVNFEAVRAFTLAATGHQGGQLSAPTGNFVCTVRKNATTIGTITFGTSSFSHSITATSFAAGEVLSVETPAADLGIDTPFWTFFMTLA